MKTTLRVSVVVLICASMTAAAQTPEPAKINLLEVANGTVVLSVSSQYNSSWGDLNLIDGTTKYGWCSAKKAPLPHTLVLELPQTYALSSVVVDNTSSQEPNYPGISAKEVAIFGSTASATTGFTPIATLAAPAAGRKEVQFNRPVTVQWLKFVVNSNWGNAEYTEIMELEAYGAPVGQPPKVDVSGVYQTNYGPLRVVQEGTRVFGCYRTEGTIIGNLNGRVMKFQWWENQSKTTGPAIMVLSMKGDALIGVWYQDGQLRGTWSGKRGGPPPSCTVPRDSSIASNLASTGRVALYGIYFDSDSAVLKPESERTLNEILNVLTTQPTLKLQVAGHTDSTNTDAYNLKLSQQRAEAVMAWLITHGIAPSRLSAHGYGKTQPVADNATSAGRALNRRVELVVQ